MTNDSLENKFYPIIEIRNFYLIKHLSSAILKINQRRKIYNNTVAGSTIIQETLIVYNKPSSIAILYVTIVCKKPIPLSLRAKYLYINSLYSSGKDKHEGRRKTSMKQKMKDPRFFGQMSSFFFKCTAYFRTNVLTRS